MKILFSFVLIFSVQICSWAKVSEITFRPMRNLENIYWSGIEATLLSEEEAKRIFIDLAAKREMAWDFPNDQCYARAYWTSYLLSRIGIKPLSVWAVAPEGAPQLRVETLNDPRGCTTWTFHVSSAFVVENSEGQRRLLVVDPSLSASPLELWDWIALMSWHYPRYTRPIVWASHPYVYRMEDLGERNSNELLRRATFDFNVLNVYESLMAKNRKTVDSIEYQKKLAELRYLVSLGQNPARTHPNPCPP